MKKILGLFLLGLLVRVASAQTTTTITATVVDPDGSVWSLCKWRADLVGPGIPFINGVRVTATSFSGACDAFGTFTQVLPTSSLITPSGFTWQFTIASNTSAQASTGIFIPTVGGSQNISSSVNSQIVAPRFPAAPTAYGYADAEITPTPLPGGQYFNTGASPGQRVWSGVAWGSGSGSASINAAPQYRLFLQPNTGTNAIAGPATTATNAQAPMINSVKDASQYCTTPGTLDYSCFANSIANNTTITVPAGTYSIGTMVTISQSNVTIQCLKGATLLQNVQNGFYITGTNVVFDGCAINANGNSGEFFEIQNANGVTIKNGSILNTVASYTIRVDTSSNIIIDNNTCATIGCGQIFSANNIYITHNKGSGQFAVQSPGTGGTSTSVTFSDNDMSPVPGQYGGILVVQDASGGNNPIQSLTVTGNHCVVTNTTNINQVFGCISIVQNVSKCVITGNTFDAQGQYLSDAALEIGVDSCVVSGNVFTTTDTHSLGYYDIAVYGGNNIISSNLFQGWATANNGTAIFFYPQTSSAGAHNADNNIFSNNIFLATGNEQYALEGACNIASSSANNAQINGNTFVGAGTSGFTRTINWADSQPSQLCPTSFTAIDNNFTKAAIGFYTAQTTAGIGFNTYATNVATPWFQNGGTVVLPQLAVSPTTIPSVAISGLAVSGQPICNLTGGNVTNIGCAAANQGSATLIPSSAGWYRILNSNTTQAFSGTIDMKGSASGMEEHKIADLFLSGSAGGTTSINLRTTGVYGGNAGIVDEIRTSTDGTFNLYVDVHVTNTTTNPVTITYTGTSLPSSAIVASPVVGAVVGSTSVNTINLVFSNPILSRKTTGGDEAYSYNSSAGGPGFLCAGSQCVVTATFTTTTSTSESIAINGMSSSGHCGMSPGNATAATNSITSYISSYNSNSITLAHAATAGMVYNFVCSSNY